jgi:hypothetical protein
VSVNDPALGARLKDYYSRQIALCEALLDEAKSAALELEEDALDAAVARQQRRTKQLLALEEEFRILKREWDAEGLADENEAAHVAGMERRAGELVDALLEANRAATGLIDERLVVVKDQWAQLRKGRETLKRYRAGDPGEGGFLDREA